jgi:hypothetical protein
MPTDLVPSNGLAEAVAKVQFASECEIDAHMAAQNGACRRELRWGQRWHARRCDQSLTRAGQVGNAGPGA